MSDWVAGILRRTASSLMTMPFLRLVAIIAALQVLLSVWIAWIAQINNDGIFYVEIARLYAQGDYAEALSRYRWPAYPILIAALSAVTRLDALIVAHVVNVAAIALSPVLIVALVHLRSGDRLFVLATALLLFANYSLNETRSALVRDHLFAALMIVSFWYHLRDHAAPSWWDKAGFTAAGLLASLFRIEAFAFVILVPLLRIVIESRSRTVRTVAVLAMAAGVAAAPLGLALWIGVDPVNQLATLLVEPSQRIEILRNEVLAPYSGGRAALAYMSIVIGLAIAGIIQGIGVLNVGLTAYGAWVSAALRKSEFFYLTLVFLAVAAITALVQIFFKVVFDPPRHIGLLALIMTMPAGLALVELGRRWIVLRDRSRLTTVLVALVCILVPYGFFGGLRFYDASYFTVTASEWLQAHAPRNARILSNNHSILFYGGFGNYDSNFSLAVGRDRSIAALRDWNAYDYIVLHLRHSRLFLADELEQKLGKAPIKTFENSRGDKVVIFRPLP